MSSTRRNSPRCREPNQQFAQAWRVASSWQRRKADTATWQAATSASLRCAGAACTHLRSHRGRTARPRPHRPRVRFRAGLTGQL